MTSALKKILSLPVNYETIREIAIFKPSENPSLIPHFLSSVRAGIPTAADDYVEKTVSIEEYLIRNPKETFLLTASGDSMEDVISDGDLLIVDRTNRNTAASKGKIAIVSLNGEMTVKRIKIINNKLWLVAENPAYNPILVRGGDSFEVFGIVTCRAQFL